MFPGITTTTTTVTLDKGEPYSWKIISKNSQTTQTGLARLGNFIWLVWVLRIMPLFPADLKSPKSGSTVEDPQRVKLLLNGMDRPRSS